LVTLLTASRARWCINIIL